MAKAPETLVQFTADVSPYCKGDVVKLDAKEKKRVDAVAEKREIDTPYKKYEAPSK